MFSTFLSQHARHGPHLLPFWGAGHVPPELPTVDVHGQNLTGGWSIICEEILIVRLPGTASGSTSFRNLTSRVGNQCLVPGVRTQTSKICFRCHALWRSPLSCHLKYGCLPIRVTMASTHSGWFRLASLRSSASRTLLNLYRPFRA